MYIYTWKYTWKYLEILRSGPPFTLFGKKRQKMENTYYRCLRGEKEEIEKMASIK